MEDILAEVKQLSNKELQKQLQTAGLPSGPLLPSTTSLFQKKLAKFIFVSRGGDDQTDSSPTQKIENCSDENKENKCDVDNSPGQSTTVTPGSDRPTKDAVRCCETDRTPIGSSIYYAVCIPKLSTDEVDSPHHPGSLHVYSERSEALQIVKKNKGARFKAFKSKKDAEVFAQSDPVPLVSPKETGKNNLPVVTKEKPNEFKSLKMQDLVKLRKAIEKGEKETFTALVWSNPRYLISSGDTPVILQEGFRYNALHVAAKGNKADMCSLILDTLMDPKFLYLMYPDDDSKTHVQRMDYLLDLYINMPEKGKCETPLHFASKFGNVDVVEVLATHSVLDKRLRNRDGHTASEIACSRSGPPEVKDRIIAVLKDQYYVPLLRAEDNATVPAIGDPWSPDTELHQSSPLLHYKTNSPIDPVVSVKAYAGPMSATQAENFHRIWKTPPRVCERKKVAIIKRSDSEKGLERLGRDLAQDMNVPWIEFWEFLGCYADMSSEEGLKMLEKYLGERTESEKSLSDGNRYHQDVENTSRNLNSANEDNEMKFLTGSLEAKQPADNQNMDTNLSSDSEIETFSNKKIPDVQHERMGFSNAGIATDSLGLDSIQKCLKFTDHNKDDMEIDTVDGEQVSSLSCVTPDNNKLQNTCTETSQSMSVSKDDQHHVNTLSNTMETTTRTNLWGEWRKHDSSLTDSFSSTSSDNNSSLASTPSHGAMISKRTVTEESLEGVFGKLSLGDSTEDKTNVSLNDNQQISNVEQGGTEGEGEDIQVCSQGEGNDAVEVCTQGEGKDVQVRPQGEGDADNGDNQTDKHTDSLSTSNVGSLAVRTCQSDSDSSHYTSLSSGSDSVYVDAKHSFPSISSSPGSKGTPAVPDIGFVTPQTYRNYSGNKSYADSPVFLEGHSPTKLDLDVLRAIQTSNDVERYPNIHKWKHMVESFPKQIQISWPSPAAPRLRRSGSVHQPRIQRRQISSPLPFWNSSPLAEFRLRHMSEPIFRIGSPSQHKPVPTNLSRSFTTNASDET